jgi:hypothetical protein
MKKLLGLIILSSVSYADLISDTALTATAHGQAQSIKSGCIDSPPITPWQISWCTSTYGSYTANLQTLNLPYPISTSTDGYVSPYSWSPYDICRFETGRVVSMDLCN